MCDVQCVVFSVRCTMCSVPCLECTDRITLCTTQLMHKLTNTRWSLNSIILLNFYVTHALNMQQQETTLYICFTYLSLICTINVADFTMYSEPCSLLTAH